MLKFIKDVANRIKQFAQNPGRQQNYSAYRDPQDNKEMFEEINRTGREIPNPAHYIGKAGAKIVKWDHPDDMFVDFTVVGSINSTDRDRTEDYIRAGHDQGKMRSSFLQITVAISDMVIMSTMCDLKEISPDHYCHPVVLRNSPLTFGLLLVDDKTYIDILRRSHGTVEEEGDDERYRLQYMAFDEDFVKELGINGAHHLPVDLTINFAPYEADEDPESFKEIPNTDTVNLSHPA